MDKRDFEKIQNTIMGGLNKGLTFGLGDKNKNASNYGEKITNELFKKIGERVIDQSTKDTITNDVIANFGLLQLANNLAQANLLNQISEQDESPELEKEPDEETETDLQKSEEDTPKIEEENEDEDEEPKKIKPEPTMNPNELADNLQNEPRKKNPIGGGENIGNEPEPEDENPESLPQNNNEANAENEYNNKRKTPTKRNGRQAKRGTENPEPTNSDLSTNQINEQIEPDEPFEFVDENEIEKTSAMETNNPETETLGTKAEPNQNSTQKNFDEPAENESLGRKENDYNQFPTENKSEIDNYQERNPNINAQENPTNPENTQSQTEQDQAIQLQKERQSQKRDATDKTPVSNTNQTGQTKPRQHKQLLQEVAEAKKKLRGPEKKINRIKKTRKIIRILAAICWLLGVLLFWCGIGEIFMGFAVSLNGSSLWMKEMLLPLELQAKPLRKNLEEKRKKLAKALKEDKGKFRSGELSQRYNNYINRVSNSPNKA
ncbi:MAG: hypothetical protein KBD73_03135 [Candidatus Magasanikbacteria bacterium]|nr:hypothetical protein [Candidatus Magasanikbacteria bacterium]